MSLSLASTVKLPQTGYLIPIIGLGVYQNDDCSPACLAALKHGYRHIDSARFYGNEREVGKALKESGLKREDVFITSKIFHPDFGYESTLTTMQDSLKNLDSSYYDLYLIHSPISGKEKRLETYRGLVEAQKRGWVRTIGVSNYSAKHLEEIKEAGYPTPSVNQVELHPLCQQKPIVDYCTKHNILVQAYTPLLRGAFDNSVLQAVSKKHKKDPAQILVRWSVQRGFVPLPKSSHPDRIVSNAAIFDFELDKDDMAKLDGIDRGKDGAVTWNPVDED